MATATLSVRMDGRLKQSASERLAAMGVSASEAVRRLFEYVDATGSIPDMALDADEARSRRLAEFDETMAYFDSAGVSFGDPAADWGQIVAKERGDVR